MERKLGIGNQNEKSQPESSGGGLKKYVYRDNSAGRKIVFECVAEDILEADKMYEEKTGRNPEKQSYVDCSIEKVEANNKNL